MINIRSTLALAALVASAASHAQGLEIIKHGYQEAPLLPLAPLGTVFPSNSNSTSPDFNVGGVGGVGGMGKEPKPFQLFPGKGVSLQIQDIATASGWDVLWEASDFSLEKKLTLSGDFKQALTTLVEAANSSGTHLRATFYRGNKTVRVQEF